MLIAGTLLLIGGAELPILAPTLPPLVQYGVLIAGGVSFVAGIVAGLR